jgi:hypothetical protein
MAGRARESGSIRRLLVGIAFQWSKGLFALPGYGTKKGAA